MLDVAHRRWSDEVVAAAGIDAAWLPTLYESIEVSGRISDEGAKATGLRAGTPVVGGAGDQAAGAVGMGIVRPGAVSATIGTSGVVFAATDRPALDPKGRIHTFLSRDSRPLARDGRDPGGRSFSALVPR